MPSALVRRGAPLVGQVVPGGPPDPLLALERYGPLADAYDTATASGAPYRRQTVEALALLPGETVLEVGCGTGLNFASIELCIGSGGRLIGVDPSPEMLERAGARVREHGWQNVLLFQATAQDARLPAPADAALLCGVHDVLRSPTALANVLRHVRAGGRIVAGGPKWAPWRQPGSIAVNLATWIMNRDYVTTFEGFDRPWSNLAAMVPDLHVEAISFGTGYIAHGTRP
ncbi:MAG: methyltransferase domain-containing protein [Solirubrobacterales bacterium]|nr:methyltransferase domain-containing protein [Solirubrobacterales bacterium]